MATSMTALGKRLTGCTGVFARTLDGIASDPNVASYSRRSDAVKAAAMAHEWHRQGSDGRIIHAAG
jgi:hypothetical protein